MSEKDDFKEALDIIHRIDKRKLALSDAYVKLYNTVLCCNNSDLINKAKDIEDNRQRILENLK